MGKRIIKIIIGIIIVTYIIVNHDDDDIENWFLNQEDRGINKILKFFRFLDLKILLKRVLWSTNPFIKNKKFFSQNIPPYT